MADFALIASIVDERRALGLTDPSSHDPITISLKLLVEGIDGRHLGRIAKIVGLIYDEDDITHGCDSSGAERFVI